MFCIHNNEDGSKSIKIKQSKVINSRENIKMICGLYFIYNKNIYFLQFFIFKNLFDCYKVGIYELYVIEVN